MNSNKIGDSNYTVMNKDQILFEARFEDFHEKHPEPYEIFCNEGSFNLCRSTNFPSRFLLVFKSHGTYDESGIVQEMLETQQSLEYIFGKQNVYLQTGHHGWMRIYCFFDLETLLSKSVNRFPKE